MIYQIHSAVNQQLVAAVITPDGSQNRVNAGDDSKILQVSLLNLSAGRMVSPHRHLPVNRVTVGTVETWVVISGTVRATVFDIDKTQLATLELAAGQCMTLYQGGHSFETISDAVVYEIKNGPYFGPTADLEKFE